MSNQSRSTENLRKPGPLLFEIAGYRIHESGYGDAAPAGAVDVWRDGEFIIQPGPVIRALIAEVSRQREESFAWCKVANERYWEVEASHAKHD